RALHFHNGVLTPIATGTTQALHGIWAPDPDHAYITGDGGTLLEWKRSNPTVMTPDPTLPTGTTDDFNDIDGASGVAWASVRNTQHVWRKPAGGAWESLPVNAAIPTVGYRLGVVSADNVFLVGNDSTSGVRWNGSQWTYEDYPSWRPITSMFTLPDGKTI